MIVEVGSQTQLKQINRMALVRQLCVSPGLSRVDLAEAVGLTKSTVSLLVRELLSEGYLIERGVIASGDLGRRPTPLFIDPTRLVLVGAEVDIDVVRVVATSLTGDVQACTVASYDPLAPAAVCISALASVMLEICKQLDASQQIIGIGIGLPGGVDETRGVLNFAPNLGWHDVPFGDSIKEKLCNTPLADIALFLQNEADVAALGELEFNPTPSSDPLIYVSINQGVGAGVVVEDKLLTGARGFAGEVGHMILQMGGPACSCGRRGCAEALIGSRAFLNPPGREDSSPSIATMTALRASLAAGDANSVDAVAKAGRYLGVLLQNLTTAYDPACVVLGGSVVELGDIFLQPALDTLHQYLSAAHLPSPVVRNSRFGSNAVAVGAAALARYRLFRPSLPRNGAMVKEGR